MSKYEQMKKIISKGSGGVEDLKAAKEELHEYFKELHKEYNEAAAAYKKSYEEDVHKAAGLLGTAEDEAAAIQIRIGEINAAMPKLLVSEDTAKIEEVEKKTRALEAQLREKEKRITLLQNYKPTGDDDLYKAAIDAEDRLQDAYEFARKQWSDLASKIHKEKYELELMETAIGNGTLGIFEIEAITMEDIRGMHDKGGFLGDVINGDDRIREQHKARAKAFMEQRKHLKEMGIDLDR